MDVHCFCHPFFLSPFLKPVYWVYVWVRGLFRALPRPHPPTVSLLGFAPAPLVFQGYPHNSHPLSFSVINLLFQLLTRHWFTPLSLRGPPFCPHQLSTPSHAFVFSNSKVQNPPGDSTPAGLPPPPVPPIFFVFLYTPPPPVFPCVNAHR